MGEEEASLPSGVRLLASSSPTSLSHSLDVEGGGHVTRTGAVLMFVRTLARFASSSSSLATVPRCGVGLSQDWRNRLGVTAKAAGAAIATASHSSSPDGELVSINDHIDELHSIPLEDVRNFCIIAHVDHGKSSLASRLLEYTGNLSKERQAAAWRFGDHQTNKADEGAGGAERGASVGRDTDPSSKDTKEEITLLDTLSVERKRGITVKASAASMLYRHPAATNPKGWMLLNMVDTPGHADFGMEVTKSLDSVEGAVLLFDAAQGVQAQTLSVHDKARSIGRLRAGTSTPGGDDEVRGWKGDSTTSFLVATNVRRSVSNHKA